MKARSGEVTAAQQVDFSVSNVGRLAGITSGLLKAYPNSRRTWVDLIDSSHFPYEESAGVAWFDRADALDRVAGIVARHGLRAGMKRIFGHFLREGYIVLEEFVPRAACERINGDLDAPDRLGCPEVRVQGTANQRSLRAQRSRPVRSGLIPRSSRSSRRSSTIRRFPVKRSTSSTAVSRPFTRT